MRTNQRKIRSARSTRFTSEPLERRVLLSSVIAVGPEFQVNTHTMGAQIHADIAMDREGNFVVVWQSAEQDGAGWGIFAQRYDSMGIALGSEFQVNATTIGDQAFPSAAMNPDGGFVITWESPEHNGDELEVYARRYNSSGMPQGSEFRVNTYTTGDQSRPAVAMDSEGNFVVVWQSFQQDGETSWAVFGQRYDSAGLPQGAEFRVSPGVGNAASVASDADGNFVVVWTTGSIWARRFDALGEPDGDAIFVGGGSMPGFSAFDVTVAMNSDGKFVVVWQNFRRAGSLYARLYDAGATPQTDEFLIEATGVSNSFISGGAAMDAGGNFIVAWHLNIWLGGGYFRAQRYDANGNPLGEPFNLESTDSRPPAIAMTPQGDAATARPRWSGSSNQWDIFAQRFAVVPEITASAFLFESSPHRIRINFERDVRDSLSVDDLLVENLTTGQVIPSHQFALLYDSAYNVATFMYVGSGNDAIGGVLPDGNYRATLFADGVATPAGAPLVEDHVFDFFFLNGDANRDGVVNLLDFNRLAANFGRTDANFTHGDFTFDGVVNLADFQILAGRFGASLPALSSSGAFASFGDDRIADEEDLVQVLLG